jgi:hypothetical protein
MAVNRILNNSFFSLSLIFINFLLLFSHSCIVPYETEAIPNDEMLIVEGLITNEPRTNIIKLSTSLPFTKSIESKPLKGGKVWISDDLGRIDSLSETFPGTYITDSTEFIGKTGSTYKLHIKTKNDSGEALYESHPMKMQPVPEIDSIYYKKKNFTINYISVEGCDIFFDTYDVKGEGNFYRWDYSETWEFHIPFDVPNKICWRTENSDQIYLKNSKILKDKMILQFPLLTVTNPIDRLDIKYSILLRQYSLNEDEYLYWERVKNTSEQIGGMHDIVPSAIPNNIICIDDPYKKALGFFSVSAVTEKRLFIKDKFQGINARYVGCIDDTLYPGDIPDRPYWVLSERKIGDLEYKVITFSNSCFDCTIRGTNIKPSYWDND